jgi:protein-tyrosine phosphatase
MAALYEKGQSQPGGLRAEPLYEASGASHIVRFLDYLDRRYGGVEPYLATGLGIGPKDIARLRQLYLEPAKRAHASSRAAASAPPRIAPSM